MHWRFTVWLMLASLPIGVYADWMDFFRDLGAQVVADPSVSELGVDQLGDGLREALVKGAKQAVSTLGAVDGFLGNNQVRIPMPDHLNSIEKGLRMVGQGDLADEFVTSMNRAAERAVPEALSVFVDVIGKMSFEDAKAILNGGDHAATDYLRKTSSASLREKFMPDVVAAVNSVGVTRQYQELVDKADFLSNIVDTQALDLNHYVTDRALDGLFYMVAEQERQIREDPAARTSELLKKVFGEG
ncbi:MAG: DUF4197 domain-containing protein [Pseudomonadota bacterium]